MERGEGIYLYDSTGKEYIDCAAATFNLSLGYNHPEVIEAVQGQLNGIVHVTSSYMTEPVAKLVEKLIEVTPKSLTKIHLKVSGGSTANEGAIKMAQNYHGKPGVLSLFRSHVGQTIYTMNASGLSFRRQKFPNLLQSGITHVPPAYCYRCFYNQTPDSCETLCVSRINEFIDYGSSGDIACMILEPILGNGDNIIPPPEYFWKLRKLADERNFALIFDEIQTGVGRTGEMFAADYFGVEPDIMTIAKGLGGSGFQIAAIAAREEYANLEGHHHSFTYGSNVLASAAALKTLDIISQPEFLDNVKNTGEYIVSYLQELQKKHPFIGDVRGAGLMIGFEIVDENGAPDLELTHQITKLAFNNGLIFRTSRYGFGNVIKIRPSLTLTMREARNICDRLDFTLQELANSYV
ncbi:aspartate aminotransferase family protein [Sporosarcina sp. PTS2304]|nr:aspartate aminotransferase family protein [Sporosarcina sp. PTS2304]